MRRREFITLLCGAATTWPLGALAQQPERMRRIGVLIARSANDKEGQAFVAAFLQGLQELGWSVGHNVIVDIRWSADSNADARKYAAELVALAPDVILAQGSSPVASLLQVTSTVPIVFANVADPVGAGYVDSLARPGGNITGFAPFEYSMSGKWLQLLKEIAPGVTRVAVFRDPSIAAGPGQFAAIQAVAPSLGVELRPFDVRNLPLNWLLFRWRRLLGRLKRHLQQRRLRQAFRSFSSSGPIRWPRGSYPVSIDRVAMSLA